MWPRVTAKLAGDPHGQALLDAMDDECQLLGPGGQAGLGRLLSLCST